MTKKSGGSQDHLATLWHEDQRSSRPGSQMRIKRAPIGRKNGRLGKHLRNPAGTSAIPASRWPHGSRRLHVPERKEDLEDRAAGSGAAVDREPGVGRRADRAGRAAGGLDGNLGEGPGLDLRWREWLRCGAGPFQPGGGPAGAKEVFVVDRPARSAGAGERYAVGLFGWNRPERQALELWSRGLAPLEAKACSHPLIPISAVDHDAVGVEGRNDFAVSETPRRRRPSKGWRTSSGASLRNLGGSSGDRDCGGVGRTHVSTPPQSPSFAIALPSRRDDPRRSTRSSAGHGDGGSSPKRRGRSGPPILWRRDSSAEITLARSVASSL
jgi:hypothetical protein